MKVLQIEDNAADARLVKELLNETAQGAVELTVAERLSLGLEILRSTPYDLVLLDLGLPDSHGMETFDRLHAEFPEIAIVVLSGLEDEETAINAMNRGAQDYLCKGEDNGRSFLRAMRHAVERKRFRKKLTEERDLLRAVINSLPDHIYVKDTTGRFKRVNSAAASFFGLEDPDHLLGKTDFDLFPQEMAQQFFDEEQRILKSGQALVNREVCIAGPGGQNRWVLTTKAPLQNHTGIRGTVGINRDVTNIKEAEEHLRAANAELACKQADLQRTVAELQRAHQELHEAQWQLIEVAKFQTVGRLAAGVAHEVKNPLAVALRGIECLSHMPEVGQDPSAAMLLVDMHDAVRRAEKVIHGLLDFAAPRQLSAAPKDVNELLDGALQLVKHDLVKQKVSVEKELDPLLPRCRLDTQKIQEVFINVFENAIHAMPQGGTLFVRTFQKTVTGVGTNVGDRSTYGFKTGKAVIVIEIQDTGTGIPEDKLPKVFDPFFTTKPTGQGNGLGLSVSKTIVDLHGGTIEVANCYLGGTKVVIMFSPASPAEEPAPLVIEDERFHHGNSGNHKNPIET